MAAATVTAIAAVSRTTGGRSPVPLVRRMIRTLSRLSGTTRRHLVLNGAWLKWRAREASVAAPGGGVLPPQRAPGIPDGATRVATRDPRRRASDAPTGSAAVSVAQYVDAMARVKASTTDQIAGHRIVASHEVVMESGTQKGTVPSDALLGRLKTQAAALGANAIVGVTASHTVLPPTSELASREYSVLLMGTAVTVVADR